jgi:hypothetical protein
MRPGADPVILDELAGQPELDQLLARALVYRLVTEMIFRRDDRAGLAQEHRWSIDVVSARASSAPKGKVAIRDRDRCDSSGMWCPHQPEDPQVSSLRSLKVRVR